MEYFFTLFKKAEDVGMLEKVEPAWLNNLLKENVIHFNPIIIWVWKKITENIVLLKIY
jgi:hypothetical protein